MYNTWEVADPKFAPARRNIQSITNAAQALVTTINPHGYLSGTVVRLDIPEPRGMQAANHLTGTITVTSPSTFFISIDTSQMDPYVVVLDPNITSLWDVCAQVVPIGEDNGMLTAAVQDTGRV
jgi:hypothetical protein